MKNFVISLDTLKLLIPKNKTPELWVDPLNKMLTLYNIDSISRISAFISQTAHESADYTTVIENLNYSAQGLANTWPNRYAIPGSKPLLPNTLATVLARKPEAIANTTYANRMGNGTVDSGDGWRYRGRGLIQLTGKERYTQFAAFAKKTHG